MTRTSATVAVRRSLLAGIVAVAIPTGCQLVAGLHAPDAGADLAGDASQLPIADGAPELPLACRSQLPDPPPQATDPGGLTIELVFSYYTQETTPPTDAGEELCPKSGFFLDDQPCVPTPASVAGTDGSACRTSCRGVPPDAGVDNVGGDLISRLGSEILISGTPNSPTHNVEQGGANVMLRITRYNGSRDDDEVGVEFLSLAGLSTDTFPLPEAALPDEGAVDAAGWAQLWDRRSLREWDVDPGSLVDGSIKLPKSRGTAFVSNGILVVRLGVVPATFGAITLNIEHATFSGELRQNAQGWTLVNGRLGGEVPFAELDLAVRTFAGDHPSFCESLAVVAAEAKFCNVADRGHDGGCDAISMAASFTMVEGRQGIMRTPPIATPCTPELCPR